MREQAWPHNSLRRPQPRCLLHIGSTDETGHYQRGLTRSARDRAIGVGTHRAALPSRTVANCHSSHRQKSQGREHGVPRRHGSALEIAGVRVGSGRRAG